MELTRELPAARRLAFGFLALLAGGAASAAGVLVANPGKMTRYEVQPGYTLVATDNNQLKRDMTKLPRLKATLEKSLGIPVKSTGIPTYVYVVSDSIWDRYLEPSSGIPSEFVPTRFANYIIANNTTMNRINLFHEHTHLYLYNQMPGVYPVWFDEGLAVMMARAMYTGSKVEIYPKGQSEDQKSLLAVREIATGFGRSGELFARRSASERDGSPSKSMIMMSPSVTSTCPR